MNLFRQCHSKEYPPRTYSRQIVSPPGQFPSPPRTFRPTQLQLLKRKYENWHEPILLTIRPTTRVLTLMLTLTLADSRGEEFLKTDTNPHS